MNNAKGIVFKFGDNVDTDVIIPARYLNSSDPAELATHCNAINIGLPIIECPEASRKIQNGDEVEIDFNTGVIQDLTTGESFQGQAFPEFMQKIIAAEGLINYINSQK